MKTYRSGKYINALHALEYSKTHDQPYRILAYRDFPKHIEKFPGISKVIDFGTAAGCSANFLFNQGYNVVGVDNSPSMIQQARANYPNIGFFHMDGLNLSFQFDLAFSCFVLFGISSKENITEHLNLAAQCLRDGGIFYAITASSYLHERMRNWAFFDSDFSRNTNLTPGCNVKVRLKESDLEFYDYFWTEQDYKECFANSNLNLLEVHYPLGKASDPCQWQDEMTIPPFIVLIAQKPLN